MNWWVRISAITRKELRQLRRDRLTFGMIVGIPVMEMVLFGFAINTDVRHLRAAVADLAGTQQARFLVSAAEASQTVDVVARVPRPIDVERLLRQGRVAVGIVIPADFGRRLLRNEPPAAQLMVDSSDPVVLGAVQGLAVLRLPMRANARFSVGTPQMFEVRAYYNPERRSAVQIVPGLIGVILALAMVLFTAVAIVRERERGNLEMLITTPVRTSELMVGKILPYIMIGLIQTTLALLIGVAVFRLPIRGSLIDAYFAALVYIAACLSLGLLISTAAQTQFQAMQMAFFVFLPQILLSGFMFPFDAMPRWARGVGELLPLTHFERLIRGIILRGATITEVGREILPLTAFFIITMSLAIARFRKRLD